jgi:Family of unknown function (DUF5681)
VSVPEQEGRSSDGYKVGPGRPPREHQFKPGQSGNPGGRPKGSGVTGALRALLEQAHNGKAIQDLLAERWLKEALSGKPVHLQMLLERTEGKITEKHQVKTEPVRIMLTDAKGNEREATPADIRALMGGAAVRIAPGLPPGALARPETGEQP